MVTTTRSVLPAPRRARSGLCPQMVATLLCCLSEWGAVRSLGNWALMRRPWLARATLVDATGECHERGATGERHATANAWVRGVHGGDKVSDQVPADGQPEANPTAVEKVSTPAEDAGLLERTLFEVKKVI